MPINLEGTVAGKIIEQRARAEGEAVGRAEGEAVGRVRMLVHVLTDRFGPDDRHPAIAHRLLVDDPDGAVHAALAATSLDDLSGDDLSG